MTLYEQAVEMAKKGERVTISYLQRRLCISYLEAGKIIDQLKQDGYIPTRKEAN
jgi:S-DNA-T family DNA segregation ATPase FtsK/SpoIIIE